MRKVLTEKVKILNKHDNPTAFLHIEDLKSFGSRVKYMEGAIFEKLPSLFDLKQELSSSYSF